jgi:hypothetical protein
MNARFGAAMAFFANHGVNIDIAHRQLRDSGRGGILILVLTDSAFSEMKTTNFPLDARANIVNTVKHRRKDIPR